MTTPRTKLADARRTPRFAGLVTFGRYPRIEDVPPENRPIDWAIFGAPFDSGVTYRPGARFGPRAIREESQYLKPYHIEHDLMISEVLSLADAGDSPVHTYDAETNAATIAQFSIDLPDPGITRPFMLGGDHSNTLANMRAAYHRAGKPADGLALLHFDSHVDTLDEFLGERYSHASPFIRAVEEGILNPKRMLSVGIKGPLNTSQDLAYARDHGVTIVTCEQWRREGYETIDRLRKAIGDAPAYLTFDIDCIDPVFAPGTGTPSVGGFTSFEALEILRHFASEPIGPPNLVGADVVEVLPDRDVAGNTSLLAAHIVFEILCLDGLRKRR